MDMLYRVGGLSGTEIGKNDRSRQLYGAPGRKRLREKLKGDKHLSQIIKRVEADLSIGDPFCKPGVYLKLVNPIVLFKRRRKYGSYTA